MNVYSKLAEARYRVLAAGMKMSGENKFAHYKYFELKDIIPVATPIFRDLGLLTVTEFDSGSETVSGNFAKMVVINAEKPDERIEFVTPVSYEPVKGTPIIQAIGAAHTYMRRYLYLLALDISECDGINATDGMPAEEKPQQKKTAKPSKAAADAPQEKPKPEESIQTAPDWASTLRGLCGEIASIQKVSAKVVYDELEKKVRQPATAETAAKYIMLAEQTLAAMQSMMERGESDG